LVEDEVEMASIPPEVRSVSAHLCAGLALGLILAGCHGGSAPSLCVLDPQGERIAVFDGGMKQAAAIRSITHGAPLQTVSPVSVAVAGDDLVLVDSVSRRILVYAQGALFPQAAPAPAADFAIPVKPDPPGVFWVGLEPGKVAYDPANDALLVQHTVLLRRTRVATRLTEVTHRGALVRSAEIPGGLQISDDRVGFAFDDARGRVLLPDPVGLVSIPRDLSFRGVTRLVSDPADLWSPIASGTTSLVAYKALHQTLEIRDLASTALLHQVSGVAGGRSISHSGLSLDEVHGEAFLADGSQVDVFALDADGAAPPLRSLATPATIAALTYDATRQRLIVAGTDGTIAAYTRDAQGGAAPAATLSARRSGSRLRTAIDLAVGQGTLWVLDNPGAVVSFTLGDGAETPIEIRSLDTSLRFDTLAVTPEFILASVSILPRAGSAGCTLPVGSPGVRAVPVGRQAFLLVESAVVTVESDSNPCPYQSIVRTLSGLSTPVDLAVDSAHDEMFVLDSSSISVFPLEASGAVAPRRTLALPAAGGPGMRILYDASRDRIDVLAGKTIASWPRTASGVAAPQQVLSFADASLEAPVAFALCQ
jgi:hypothetical protein